MSGWVNATKDWVPGWAGDKENGFGQLRDRQK